MKIFQVDAFTSEKYKGNPAAVCILPSDNPVEDEWLQNVAAEMNLPETAFLQQRLETYLLRWFTPTTEVHLCGHATLATAHIMWEEGILAPDEGVIFDTISGPLHVSRNQSLITLKLPVRLNKPCKEPVGLEMALGCSVLNTYETGKNLLVELEDEETVQGLSPYTKQLETLPAACVIVTARGNDVDFVSRMFSPNIGIDEDPATGTAHSSLAPFWSEKLNKTQMKALQLSKRGGVFEVEIQGDYVDISGHAVTVLKGELCE